jgi:hypothetical protein
MLSEIKNRYFSQGFFKIYINFIPCACKLFAGIITLARMIISLFAGMIFKRLFMNSRFKALNIFYSP